MFGWAAAELSCTDWLERMDSGYSPILKENSGEVKMENRRAETSNPDAHAGQPCFPNGELAQRLWRTLQSVPALGPFEVQRKSSVSQLSRHGQVLNIFPPHCKAMHVYCEKL